MDDDPRPPPDFDGWQNGEWDGFNYYERACTQEESELLDAHEAAMIEQERRELTEYAEKQRDGFFAMLRSEISAKSVPAPLPLQAGEGLGRGGAKAKAE